jgi:serine/threonine-protein kinase
MFGRRYRIVGLLGEGGMGEVYRADDVELGQTVALKFLPRGITEDDAALARLRNEVRVAREISHPNVCRVYDIGEVDGQSFFTMEYVDGEDLGALLRRIGRLPKEKAQQLIAQLASGLAAAHDRGVLHRDLKPGNIMIDGKGRVRIMDFGLAGFAEELRESRGIGGTLAYLAPELLAGQPPTARSDVYGLGLVMYEILTGRRAYEASSLEELRRKQDEAPPPRPSEFLSDVDPEVERVIMWCLEREPLNRPASARVVARSLPGSDPLEAALAAGETPSPGMVAASGGRGALRPGVAWSLFAVFVASVIGFAAMHRDTTLVGVADPSLRPIVLADRARGMLTELGHAEPRSTAYGLTRHTGLLEHISSSSDAADRWNALSTGRPTAYTFWYREHTSVMSPLGDPWGRVRLSEPPLSESGMARVRLDQDGRLVSYERVPELTSPGVGRSAEAGTIEVHAKDAPTPAATDWSPLLAMAELDTAQLERVAPQMRRLLPVDARAAWTGHYASRDSLPFRIEAGSLLGRPVYFMMLDLGELNQLTAGLADEDPAARGLTAQDTVAIIMVTAFLFVPAFLAWMNVRRKRADTRAAFRVALFVFAITVVSWALAATHIPLAYGESGILQIALAIGLLLGVSVGLGYLAAEPYLRRYWPTALAAWSRLIAGRVSDPLVGRDVLIGAAAAAAYAALGRLLVLSTTWAGQPLRTLEAVSGDAMLGGRFAAAQFLHPTQIVAPSVLIVLVLVFLRLFRRRWVAVLLAGATMAMASTPMSLGALGSPSAAMEVIVYLAGVAFVLLLLVRFGFLSFIAGFVFSTMLGKFPVTLDASRWYSGTSFFVMLVLTAVALWALRNATASPAGSAGAPERQSL